MHAHQLLDESRRHWLQLVKESAIGANLNALV